MPDDAPDDATIAGLIKQVGERFKDFLDLKYVGNQSVAASKLGISQPALSRVAAGDQLPSGKLLLALSRKTEINLDWLFAGRGDMLLPKGAPGLGNKVLQTPIVNRPLPGPPDAHPDLLSGELLAGCGFGLRHGQYWLRIQRGEPITRAEGEKVREGNLILMETDRSLFPEPEQIFEQLCVVRLKSNGVWQYRLAEVSYAGEGYLEADTFDLAHPPTNEIVLKPMPGGKYVGHSRPQRLKPRRPLKMDKFPYGIKSEDLIAVKVWVFSR